MSTDYHAGRIRLYKDKMTDPVMR